ncbi:hypothetical protein K469DRAFT_262107 [Zopfia rhizophila CBS 207.26]|uniref:Uncharacterized protein n=1 Tax=Zopfia rhizophila CBS 207.26 TaxID=1314779 RepID=A0A6A6DQR8_9PEZI|nr:hypothetical protein K469DRAFT_262107 [Zopfia rhizophila CBS 207.26]
MPRPMGDKCHSSFGRFTCLLSGIPQFSCWWSFRFFGQSPPLPIVSVCLLYLSSFQIDLQMPRPMGDESHSSFGHSGSFLFVTLDAFAILVFPAILRPCRQYACVSSFALRIV